MALLPADQPGGYILRTVAAEASDEELAADIGYLRRIWSEIRSRSVGALPPMLLHHDLTLAQRVLRDLVSSETTGVIIDSRENFQKLQHFAREYVPQVADRLVHYTGERPLFDLHGVEDEIQKGAGAPRRSQVRRLPDLRPDRGDDHGRRQHRRLCRLAQLRRHHLQDQSRSGAGHRAPAAPAQSRRHHHRRLHRHGQTSSTSNAVLAEFNKALARDHTRITVNGFTQLGLVEMTGSAPAKASRTCCASPVPPAADAAR
jgi:ribonuclease G